jgi:hypothetical protein
MKVCPMTVETFLFLIFSVLFSTSFTMAMSRLLMLHFCEMRREVSGKRT